MTLAGVVPNRHVVHDRQRHGKVAQPKEPLPPDHLQENFVFQVSVFVACPCPDSPPREVAVAVLRKRTASLKLLAASCSSSNDGPQLRIAAASSSSQPFSKGLAPT